MCYTLAGFIQTWVKLNNHTHSIIKDEFIPALTELRSTPRVLKYARK